MSKPGTPARADTPVDEKSDAPFRIAALSDTLRTLRINSQGLNVRALASVMLRHEQANVELGVELPKVPSMRRKKYVEMQPDQLAHDREILEQRLQQLAKQPGRLEQFCERLAERLFLAGQVKPPSITDETYTILREVGAETVKLRELGAKDRAPHSTEAMLALRTIDRKLVDYVAAHANLRMPDYVALNLQHKVLASAIRREEQAYISTLPADFSKKLYAQGLVTQKELKGWGKDACAQMHGLVALGIVHQVEVEGSGIVYAFARGKVKPRQFEDAIPPRAREKIYEELWLEFRNKYSGVHKPIGIGETRSEGLPTLLDRVRVKHVADNAGVAVSHVVLALKYLEQHRLVRTTDEGHGYQLSALGKRAGLSFSAVRFVQNASQVAAVSAVNSGGELKLESVLDAADRTREGYRMPVYHLQTKDGGAPRVILVDELQLPESRIDTRMVRALHNQIAKSEGALVVASGLIKGDPAVYPRDMRTSIPPRETQGVDLRDYGEQVSFLSTYLGGMGQPVLVLLGKRELETANIRADRQREREISMSEDEEKSEEEIEAKLGKANLIELRGARKYRAKLQAELLDLIANVVMPLEFKLGRELMGESEVLAKTGRHMNELEIVRDMAALLTRDLQRKENNARKEIERLYGDFLKLPEVGDRYVFLLEQALFPRLEVLATGEPVARGNATVQFLTPQGEKGLKMISIPEGRFGVAEVQHPLVKVMEILKTMTLEGKEVPDIVTMGAAGQPWVGMTAGGTLVVSADTLLSSQYLRDLYYATESQDPIKRRRMVRGGETSAGVIAFEGGATQDPESGEYYKTDNYTLVMANPKVLDVLERNRAEGKPSKTVDIYATSDWQIGSPTAKPATLLRGLFDAVLSGCKEIVLNGDLLQGQNYGRAVAEMQLTGLVGIEDQQAFINALLTPVLDLIRFQRAHDPNWEIPRFRVLVGNHETNSQAYKGGQGIWFLQNVATQIEMAYRYAFGAEIASSHVMYPKKFVNRTGTDVDYSHMVIDLSDEVGFRVGAQHYVGSGGKGSSMQVMCA